ncbi:NADPH--cytochrome P450 reductase [Monosporozyma servazzii]
MVDKVDILVVTVFTVAIAIYFNKDLLLDLITGASDEAFKLQNSSGSRDIVTVLKENDKNYLVVYGSQTGTTEDYAKRFAKELISKFKLNVMCADLEDYEFDNLHNLPSDLVISLFLSTYGEGEYPDSALQFETWLKNLDPMDKKLDNVNFTIFGLGNSTYEHFNGAARSAWKLLKANGAHLIGKFGLADDGAGTTDEDYLSWNEKVTEQIKTFLKLDEQDLKFESSFEVTKLESLEENVFVGEPSSQYLPACEELPHNDEGLQTGPFNTIYPYVAPIVKSYELFDPKSGRNCIHTEFDVSGSNLKYSTGDHLAIWPSNANEKVEQFIKALNLDGEMIFDLKSKDPTMKLPLPTPTTVEAAVRHYLEITGPVSRQLLRTLIQFAPTETIKTKLLDLSNDKDQFAKEINAQYFNIADALYYISEGKPWTTIPWEFILEFTPKLQPRYYSISSSALTEKQTIHVTSIVENVTNDEDDMPPVLGVTTNLLRNIQLDKAGLLEKDIKDKIPEEDKDEPEVEEEKKEEKKEDTESVNEKTVEKIETPTPSKSATKEKHTLPVHYDLDGPRNLFQGYKLPIHVRRSTFRLPTNPQTPVIMVGPGTGVAPFRGFIRERVKFQELNPNVKLGKLLLFYGSRDANDFLYREEWEEYKTKLNGSFEMVVAHSRLPNKPKVYVQDKLKDKEEEVMELLKEGAFIYVCGDAKNMAKDVNAAFVGTYTRGLKIEEAEAREIVKMLKSQGKYQEDIW